MRKLIDWKQFFILLAASLGSILAVTPYIFTIQAEALSNVPLPLPVLVLIQFVQSAVIFSVLIFIGLFLSKRVNFSLPLLEKISKGKAFLPDLKELLPSTISWGIIAATLIVISDYLFRLFGVTVTMETISTPIWQRFLASFYGGITEEVLTRLFLMTLFVWIGYKITKHTAKMHNAVVVWISIILAAVIFGLGHLPVTATLTEITPLVILRGILLNSIGGIIFGWLYWKKGLEAAMISHFTGDIMLLIIFPFLLG